MKILQALASKVGRLPGNATMLSTEELNFIKLSVCKSIDEIRHNIHKIRYLDISINKIN